MIEFAISMLITFLIGVPLLVIEVVVLTFYLSDWLRRRERLNSGRIRK